MKQSIIRILSGLIIISIGVGALLGALDIFSFWDHFREWWPMLLAVVGLFMLVGDIRKNYLWGSLLVIIGVLLTLKNQDVIEFNVFSLIFPIIIITAGLSILLSNQRRLKTDQSSADSDNITAIFSGTETINNSKSYKGGHHTAIFGGVSVDLRDAKLADDAVLDLFVVCGGVELKVPKDWRVVSKITPIAGGVENKARGEDNPKVPTLVVTGTVALGGVEISS